MALRAVGDRIELGTEAEPKGWATLVTLTDDIAILAWDTGGETVIPTPLLEALDMHSRRREERDAA